MKYPLNILPQNCNRRVVGYFVAILGVAILATTTLQLASPTYKTVRLIKKCPDWKTISPNDYIAKQKIIECLKLMSERDTKSIRNAMEKCVAEDRSEYFSRLFLINRYIFNVPDKPVVQKSASSSLIGSGFEIGQENTEQITPMWPLGIGTNLQVDLIGRFHGFIGDYDALSEFDDFNSHYGRRWPNSKR